MVVYTFYLEEVLEGYLCIIAKPHVWQFDYPCSEVIMDVWEDTEELFVHYLLHGAHWDNVAVVVVEGK